MGEQGTVSIDSVVSPSKELVFSNLADEVVILDLKSGVYHGLDSVGARIWNLMSEGTNIRQIKETLLDEYDVESDRCERDLFQLIEELKDHGLVEVQRPPGR